jgi:hypothetical protein
MIVPDVVTLQLVSADAVDLSGVIVAVTISTGRRNPRHVYFPKTDAVGASALAGHDLVGQFEDGTEADLMGSWGTIADAASEVRINLYDPARILAMPELALSWPLLPHQRKKWSSRADEYSYRSSCRNLLFSAEAIVVDLHMTNHIEFRVASARQRAG